MSLAIFRLCFIRIIHYTDKMLFHFTSLLTNYLAIRETVEDIKIIRILSTSLLVIQQETLDGRTFIRFYIFMSVWVYTSELLQPKLGLLWIQWMKAGNKQYRKSTPDSITPSRAYLQKEWKKFGNIVTTLSVSIPVGICSLDGWLCEKVG